MALDRNQLQQAIEDACDLSDVGVRNVLAKTDRYEAALTFVPSDKGELAQLEILWADGRCQRSTAIGAITPSVLAQHLSILLGLQH